jgi:hypothetical protein
MSLTLSYVDHLQRQNVDDLAFYPLTTLAKAIETNHVIDCQENGEPAGYLWFGALRGGYDVTIYQACVDYTARRRHLGFGMVAQLHAMAKAAGCNGIRLKCAPLTVSIAQAPALIQDRRPQRGAVTRRRVTRQLNPSPRFAFSRGSSCRRSGCTGRCTIKPSMSSTG